MLYHSTRNNQEFVSSSEAIIQGLAKDGGLYIPCCFPDHLNYASMQSYSYQEIAYEIIHAFFDDLPSNELKQCIQKAYDTKFDCADIVPLHKTNHATYMELFHGPTSAFKDIALSFLPHLMPLAYQTCGIKDKTITILTATSGDTGKAALSGFRDVPNTAIQVFYPENGVSPIQKLQMQTSLGNNVSVVAIQGNFDDCQSLVKQAYQSKDLIENNPNVILSSANSINIGRLIPQMVYYVSSYLKLVNDGIISYGTEINYVVPSGNFGDILAGYFAKCTGLPIKHLICASNTNHVLTDFLKTGTYNRNRPFYETMSPSMDILISSNLERLLGLLGSQEELLQAMTSLQETGSYTISPSLLKTIQETFTGYWIDEETCSKEIHTIFQQDHYLIDPHTAIASAALRKHKAETNDDTYSIVLSTASPYKFPSAVLSSLNLSTDSDEFEQMQQLHNLSHMPIPENLLQLKELPIRFTKSITKEEGLSNINTFIKEVTHV